ncbi:MAG: hypothetical protein IPM40_20950 [Gammaproteobacteria bacterium]|nr:hypothetical protein [Gammaproteobacteria bacterium]
MKVISLARESIGSGLRLTMPSLEFLHGLHHGRRTDTCGRREIHTAAYAVSGDMQEHPPVACAKTRNAPHIEVRLKAPKEVLLEAQQHMTDILMFYVDSVWRI